MFKYSFANIFGVLTVYLLSLYIEILITFILDKMIRVLGIEEKRRNLSIERVLFEVMKKIKIMFDGSYL